MGIAKLLTATVAGACISITPALAQTTNSSTNSAARLSIASAKSVRTAAPMKKANSLSPAVIIGVLLTAAIIGGAVALADNDDDPDSK